MKTVCLIVNSNFSAHRIQLLRLTSVYQIKLVADSCLHKATFHYGHLPCAGETAIENFLTNNARFPRLGKANVALTNTIAMYLHAHTKSSATAEICSNEHCSDVRSRCLLSPKVFVSSKVNFNFSA